MILIGIGIAITILVGSLRQKTHSLIAHSVYWVFFILLGIWSLEGLPYVYLFGLILPFAIRLITSYWFTKDLILHQHISSILMIIVLGSIILYTPFDFYILGIYLSIEFILIIKWVVSNLKRHGVSFGQNSGKRVNLIISFYTLNIPLALALLLTSTSTGIDARLFLEVVLLVISGISLFIYAGFNDAYKPIFGEAKYAKSSLEAAEKYRILNEIENQIRKNKFHLDQDASLQNLANLVHANIHQVSQVLNEKKGMTFFELIAYHRVQEGKKLLRNENYKKFKIEQIAEEVGYLSKSAFNTSFKKITGFTPSEYRNSDVRDHKIEHQEHKEIARSLMDEGTFGYVKNSTIMFSSFLKVFLRTQLRNKAFSAINLIGLVLGITSTLLIIVYLNHELSYDKFHTNAQDIYRVVWLTGNPQTRTPHPMAQALVRDFPQVRSGVSLTPVYGPGLTLQSIYVRNSENNVMFKEPDIFLADSTFFDVFDFKLVAGDKKDALDDVGDIVISDDLARKYFGDEDPLGKSLEIVEYDFRGIIAGVMETPPSNSHFHPKLLVSYITRKSADPDHFWFQWNDFGHFNYVRLDEGSDPADIVNAIPEWLTNYLELTQAQVEDMQSRLYYLDLQPITDIHLHSNLRWELEANSNIIYVYILIAAVIFLVTIASINFVNLTTARAFERSKEVGMRRALGAKKSNISFQFIAESVFICIMALAIAYLSSFLLFDQFNQLVGQNISPQRLFDPEVIIFAVVIAIFIGIITGIYPSSFLTKIKPVDVLKGKFVNRSSGSSIRKILISIQFVVSTIMIFGSLVILGQIQYMEGKELGFDDDEILVVELHSDEEVSRLNSLKAEMKRIPGILMACGISNLPGGQFNQNEIFPVVRPDDQVSCSELRVDFDALELLGINLRLGRWFDPSMKQDSLGLSFIVNEAAYKGLNLENPFEDKIIWNEEIQPREGKIVGVIEDFHYKSLHKSIQPLVINVNPSSINYLLLKIEAGNSISGILDKLEDVHYQFDDQFQFDYFFLNQLVQNQYESERKALGVFNLFTTLALVLASMGLLGLAYLVITQRTREIGIRKVMGARVMDILVMENKTFLKVILISLIIGLPTSYFVMQTWLEAFAYRIGFSIWPFIITILMLSIIAIASVSLAVLRTILKNPSVALRYE